jgi:hypothetical protein
MPWLQRSGKPVVASAMISMLTQTMRVSPLQGLDTVFMVGFPRALPLGW